MWFQQELAFSTLSEARDWLKEHGHVVRGVGPEAKVEFAKDKPEPMVDDEESPSSSLPLSARTPSVFCANKKMLGVPSGGRF